MNPLVTVTGPSGSGKTTIVQSLVKQGLALEAISSTTRKPRVGEVHGSAYFFRSEAEFFQIRDSGGLYECVSFNQNWYGIERAIIDDFVFRLPTLIMVEPEGALQLRKNYTLGPIFNIYLDVEFADCVQRMIGRGDDPEVAARRSAHDVEYFPSAAKGIKWDLVVRNYDARLTSRLLSLLISQ